MSKKPRQSSPVRMLIDPCVWSDLLEDPVTSPLIDALEDLVGSGDVALIVTPLILGEFAQSKARLIGDGKRSVSSTRTHVREATESFRNPRKTRTAVEELNGLDHRFVNLGDRTAETADRIERLLAAAEPCDVTDAVKIRASDRGIAKKAPFHRQRNGMNDAILIETYADMAKDGGGRCAFVTHNVKDFSDPAGNQALPHPDLAHLFTENRSRYFITLGEALRSIRPEQYLDLVIEQEWPERPRRRIAEIVAAEHELFAKVWYDQHVALRDKVERGQITVVSLDAPAVNTRGRRIRRDTWEAGLRAAERIATRYGPHNLGPWSDFERGMIRGKLSALRWVLGDEWDMLT
jgi:hypothetical protein